MDQYEGFLLWKENLFPQKIPIYTTGSKSTKTSLQTF
ncbi:hypothetical protein PRO82_001089 [Candidatus Protochlamydia amoebophila]|nr:hypothetical protein [Candidatus Protochlamydia amoebophila]